jgi:transposase-like protein
MLGIIPLTKHNDLMHTTSMADADILAPQFIDADEARKHLEAKRWPDGPVCPHCGVIGEATALRKMADTKTHGRKGLYQCNGCREQFSVTVGTVFEDSHLPLNKWLLAVHLLCSSKKGMSAHQLHRMLGVTYKTAWFMAHRIRYAMAQEPLSSKLNGIVEVDECYIGGKLRTGKQPARKDSKSDPARDPKANKVPVVSLVQRGGKVRSFAVERVTSDNLKPILKEMLAPEAHVMTDTATVLKSTKKEWKHDTVNHFEKEYARYENGLCISTNTVEGFFGNLKRGINGVYHHVGKQHLHRYLAEFDFRYNAREVTDKERAGMAIAGIEGKRLMYRDSFKRVS